MYSNLLWLQNCCGRFGNFFPLALRAACVYWPRSVETIIPHTTSATVAILDTFYSAIAVSWNSIPGYVRLNHLTHTHTHGAEQKNTAKKKRKKPALTRPIHRFAHSGLGHTSYVSCQLRGSIHLNLLFSISEGKHTFTLALNVPWGWDWARWLGKGLHLPVAAHF